MEAVKIPPAFMPMPKDCGRGVQPVFDGKVCIDTVICEYYCTDKCQVYVDYNRERARVGKERRERSKKVGGGSRRKDLDLDFSDRIEASEKPKRKNLEL